MNAALGKWRTAALFALLAAVTGALQWNWFAMPLERDEGEYAYAAWLALSGRGVPYRDCFLQKPPMIVYTYALVEAVAPGSDKVGFRVAGFLAALAAAGLVWKLGNRDFGGRAGLWGAWLWVAFLQQAHLFKSAAANVEKFMVVPMLGAMALVGPDEKRPLRWALGGALAAVAVLYKPICAPPLAVWFLWRMSSRPQGECRAARAKTAARLATWLALGGMLATLAALAWFVARGALGELRECAVVYTGEYAKLSGTPWEAARGWWSALGHWKSLLPPLLAATGFFRRGNAGRTWGSAMAVAWLVAMADPNGHYCVMAMPLAAIGCGAAMDRGAAWLCPQNAWAAPAAVAALSAALLAGNSGTALLSTPRQLSAWLYRGNPFVEAESAGRIVARLCPENGTVHVIGSEPEILWYARRKGATRFDIAYPLTLPTKHAGKYQREALDALDRTPPTVVVAVTTPLGFGFGTVEGYAAYLDEMARLALGGRYRLACSFIPEAGGWLPGGDWRIRMPSGATLGVFETNKRN